MWRKVIGITALVAVLTLGFWGIASAQDLRSGNTPTVGANEVVDSTLWAAGRTVNIAGDVDGDVFCAGQNVTISGHVAGDVICGAQTVTISGKIDGDVRVGAQNITLTGIVAGRLTAGAQNFTQTVGSVIGDDASIGGTDITLNGSVGRDAMLGAENVYVNGIIGRNLDASATMVSLGSNAVLAGNFGYTSLNDAELATGSQISGTTTKTVPNQTERSLADKVRAKLASGLVVLGALLFTALVLILLFPRPLNSVIAYRNRDLWRPLLIGLVAVVAVPALAVVSMITVVGFPLGLLILLTCLIIGALSVVVSAYWFGRVLWPQQHNAVLAMLVGVIATAVLLAIPVLGPIVWLLASLLGTGLILISVKKHLPKINYHVK